ncbi:hypothetical protein DBR11_26915 [Pedobacter sp. HMWF019]|uniref:outer membrane beta-barrel protein n=1 Tax=Pedobacter sp. HMWF019 TaxID=2056856 RepID=UPI000D3CA1B3|nr:hypothetical protein [Pedobacter sp. HMWF019]PTS92441.1 hypothetical protein DBR11_26915 [Pedobacter sp. HMWF019]
MEDNNNIDQFFKRGLNDPDIPFNEMDWEKMERKLDQQEKKRGIPLWLFTASGIAAAVLIFMFWFFSEPQRTDKKSKEKAATVEQTPKPSVQKNAGQDTVRSVVVVNEVKREKHFPSEKAILPLYVSDTIVPGNEQKQASVQPIVSVAQNSKEKKDSIGPKQKAIASIKNKKIATERDWEEVQRSVRKKMEAGLGQNNGLVLSLMAAPDISTAKQNTSSKLSSNVGVLATYSLTKKISLTSGAIYSRKLYNSGGIAPAGNGYATQGTAWQVDADCNVLDIPINANYKVYNKKKLSVSLNAGLSSYFMLKEKYQFITGDAGPNQKISNLEINNQNQHLFGIANVSVSFDRQITRGVSIGVAPFMKLPLTGIGNGDASLKSTGVSFSLNIGLFGGKKEEKTTYSYHQNNK